MPKNERKQRNDTADNLAELFSFYDDVTNDPLPSIHEELDDEGFKKTDRTCNECDGQIWRGDHLVICGDCSIIVSADRYRRRNDTDQWDRFHSDRPQHWNSDEKRCVGGFPFTYDWVTADDVDHPVNEISPENFYE